MLKNKKSEVIPDKVLKTINLNNSDIDLCIKGAGKEWLLCDSRQVYIVKKGFMTGHIFGFSVFQMPYKNIAGANVNFHLVTGYFEINTGGMQNTQKSYWSSDKNADPYKAQNCISIASKEMAEKFRDACTFILDKVHMINNEKNNISDDIPEQIRKLAELNKDGILTDKEFEIKKTELLSKI